MNTNNQTETVSADQVAITRKNGARIQSGILRRLAEVTQAHAAECMGVDASKVSRMKDDLEDFCRLLAAIGLQIVDSDSMTLTPEEIFALECFGLKYLEQKVKSRGRVFPIKREEAQE